MLMTESVLAAKHHAHLFSENDRALYARLKALSPHARRLYIRLSQRREGWFRLDKLHYTEIPDVTSAVDEIIGAGFAVGENMFGS